MRYVRWLAIPLSVAALLAVAAACGNGEAASPAASGEPNTSGAVAPAQGIVGAPDTALAPIVAPTERIAGTTTSSGFPVYSPAQTGSAQTGIWVTGQGKITVEPDLVLLNVGVEARAKTVAEATQKAASAMNSIVDTLKRHGLRDQDIQTRFFNVTPQYEYQEVLEGGVRSRKQVLVGYIVTNSARVKIRDLEAVGTIIDDVAGVGGDVARINGISFTVEDPTPFMTQARELAVKDALAKARQFANLTGVTVGPLVFISESGGGVPIIQDFGARAAAEAFAPAPPTPISAGELDIQLNVQAVFSIQ